MYCGFPTTSVKFSPLRQQSALKKTEQNREKQICLCKKHTRLDEHRSFTNKKFSGLRSLWITPREWQLSLDHTKYGLSQISSFSLRVIFSLHYPSEKLTSSAQIHHHVISYRVLISSFDGDHVWWCFIISIYLLTSPSLLQSLASSSGLTYTHTRSMFLSLYT